MPTPELLPRLVLTPLHGVRAGAGLDVVQVRARGYGLLVCDGTFRLVWGHWERFVLRRFSSDQVRAFFVGTHGLAVAKAVLGPRRRLNAPEVGLLSVPECAVRLAVPTSVVAPRLEVPMQVAVPEVPHV